MISEAQRIREYLLVDDYDKTCGTIKTTYPEDKLHELILEGNFEYKKEIVAAIRDKGYYCF